MSIKIVQYNQNPSAEVTSQVVPRSAEAIAVVASVVVVMIVVVRWVTVLSLVAVANIHGREVYISRIRHQTEYFTWIIPFKPYSNYDIDTIMPI